ncbi:hypothetical protein ACFQ0B_02845 [Nonomuraea thailandensis]
MHLSRSAASASLAVTFASIALSLVLGTATPAWLATMWYAPGESLKTSPCSRSWVACCWSGW